MADDDRLYRVKKQRQQDNDAVSSAEHHEKTGTDADDLFIEDASGLSPLHNTQSDIIFPNVTESKTSTRTANQTIDPIICKYFVAGACAYGSACRFSHEIPPAKLVRGSGPFKSVTSQNPTITASHPKERDSSKDSGANVGDRYESLSYQSNAKPLCRFYGSLRGCKSGAACPFLHKDEPKRSFLPSPGATEGGSILNKYSSVKIAEKAGVEAITRAGTNI